MNYYDEKQYIIAVDEEDTVVGKVEKWEAHEKSILHRAFTVGLKYKNQWVVQHRKHPVFDNVLDITSSSHPLYSADNSMQDMEDAVISTILREWEIDTSHVDRRTLQYCGKVYYKADDLLSKYHEHEVCHAYALTITEEPKFRQEFAYGMSVVPEEVLFNINSTLQLAFAPWVKPILPLFQQLKNNDEQ